ncbi:MAG TPA: D-alanyl-D-alanine carboxypeptidase family protein [Candidatus Angelobacter sp.]|jgi:D-alanyl-D-alanine carboxypeptidase (penicillin-binding protein 5/6)|nr:D-alanyl-D-alanine carboxypeptidase family protein [Candidatus Angelobacter sp.]
MPLLTALQRLSQRQRRALATALTAVVVIVVVAANQPSESGAAHPQVRPAAARGSGVTGVTTPRPTALPVLKLAHTHVNFSDDTAAHPGAPRVDAVAGILVDAATGSILWSRAPHTPLPPASTTKVLSTLVALENFDPDQVVTITADALHQAGDETVMGLKPGNRLTVHELLDGMLTVSANDAATALAVDTVGMDGFVNAMNQQVAALGLRDSHFTTPVGLDDPNQRASAYDLAAIAATDVAEFPLFRQMVAQTDVVLAASPQHPEFDLSNLNRLLRLYPAADGIKPGYTGDAGACLIGMAERDGHRLISVVLNAPALYSDTRGLLDWGFVQEGLPSLLPTPSPAPAKR